MSQRSSRYKQSRRKLRQICALIGLNHQQVQFKSGDTGDHIEPLASHYTVLSDGEWHPSGERARYRRVTFLIRIYDQTEAVQVIFWDTADPVRFANAVLDYAAKNGKWKYGPPDQGEQLLQFLDAQNCKFSQHKAASLS